MSELLRKPHMLSMIENFDGLVDGHAHPTDIDMVYITRAKVVMFGEFKNAKGKLGGQKWVLETLARACHEPCVAIYATHTNEYSKGDTEVNVAQCRVRLIFENWVGVWREPKREVLISEVFRFYCSLDKCQIKILKKRLAKKDSFAYNKDS